MYPTKNRRLYELIKVVQCTLCWWYITRSLSEVIHQQVYCSSVLSSADKIQSCYGSNFSSILPSVLIYWVFILQNNVCEVFNILHLEVMIIEIVLSMQFFSKQNNSSVFVLGLAGKKSVSSFFTPIQLCEWTPSRREMREINVEIQTLYGS